MKIKSTVAEATKYSTDALEAFYTAVDNGQARLALLILVDVIETFADKLDEFDEIKSSLVNGIEAKEVKQEKIQEKPAPAKAEESATKTESNTKSKTKEESLEQ